MMRPKSWARPAQQRCSASEPSGRAAHHLWLPATVLSVCFLMARLRGGGMCLERCAAEAAADNGQDLHPKLSE